MSTDPDVDVDEVLRAEFMNKRTGGLDLSPSVYLVTDRLEQVRVYAEHCASFLDRPSGKGLLLLEDCESHSTPGTTFFTFANSRHRELRFSDGGALRVLVIQVVSTLAEIAVQLPDPEVYGYIEERLRAGDPEWTFAMKNGSRGKRWTKKLGAWRATQSG